ncbi:hypothetical protein [Peptoniphilus indolicus]|nr:hypothetical protein [Peptoniphilus indolicus]
MLDTVDINVKYEFEESNIYPIDNKFVQLLVNGVAPNMIMVTLKWEQG